jgi:dTDP-4-dehydrorhamnose 3,5-epimerase
MEMMRDDDEFFQKFGQVYLSVVYPGVVKGWHYHKKQTDHFVFVKGWPRSCSTTTARAARRAAR